MRLGARSSISKVALVVGAALRQHGIRAVLTGGACVSLHTDGTYVSKDIDFVIEGGPGPGELDAALAEIGFRQDGDRYVHPDIPFYVEFPPGPLAVGGDVNIRPVDVRGPTGSAYALSPTDACRDRLAAFYHWDDRQSLRQAVSIARRRKVNLAAIRRWSEAEGKGPAFREFLTELRHRR